MPYLYGICTQSASLLSALACATGGEAVLLADPLSPPPDSRFCANMRSSGQAVSIVSGSPLYQDYTVTCGKHPAWAVAGTLPGALKEARTIYLHAIASADFEHIIFAPDSDFSNPSLQCFIAEAVRIFASHNRVTLLLDSEGNPVPEEKAEVVISSRAGAVPDRTLPFLPCPDLQFAELLPKGYDPDKLFARGAASTEYIVTPLNPFPGYDIGKISSRVEDDGISVSQDATPARLLLTSGDDGSEGPLHPAVERIEDGAAIIGGRNIWRDANMFLPAILKLRERLAAVLNVRHDRWGIIVDGLFAREKTQIAFVPVRVPWIWHKTGICKSLRNRVADVIASHASLLPFSEGEPAGQTMKIHTGEEFPCCHLPFFRLPPQQFKILESRMMELSAQGEHTKTAWCIACLAGLLTMPVQTFSSFQ